MMPGRSRLLLAGAVVLLPLSASANAGTALMWAGMLHLTVGNSLIGTVEGLLLARFFQLPRKRCVILMLVANYLSAFVGGLLAQLLSNKLPWSLYSAPYLLWLLVVIAYLLTLLLEWPLVAACFWGEVDWRKLSLKASLLVQTVSYLMLFGWYWMASGTSLYRKVAVVPASQIEMPTDVLLYFIGNQDGRIHELDLGTGAKRTVDAVISTNHQDRLLFHLLDTNAPLATLCLRREAERHINDSIEPASLSLAISTVIVEPENNLHRDLWSNFGSARILGTATTNDWAFRTGFWAAEGISARSPIPRRSFRLAWETPFSQWGARSAFHLPGDKVIFQFGYEQICLLDASAGKIARIAEGRGPAVALKNVSASDP